MIEEKKIIEDKVDNIILAGCSFTDCGYPYPSEKIKTQNLTPGSELQNTGGWGGELKVQHFLQIELFKQGKINNIDIYNVGRGSFGNHVITHTFKQKVTEIKEKNPNAKILGVIQLSALLRADNIQVDIDTSKFPFDYENPFVQTKPYSLQELYEHHLDNIIDLHQFCLDNDIKYYIHFGWANFFKSYYLSYPELRPKFDKIKEIVSFVEYPDTDDELRNYCAGAKEVKSSIFETLFGKKEIKSYIVDGGEYGGIIEYAKMKLEKGRRYASWFDAHPSTEAYFIWYMDKIRPFLIESGVLSNIPFPQNVLENLQPYMDICKEKFWSWYQLEYRHEEAHAFFRHAKDSYFKTEYNNIKYLLEEKAKEFRKIQ